MGGYGPQSTYGSLDLSQKTWDNSKLPWNATPKGRLAIRTFSRGVLGAAFFTAGGMLTRKWLHSEDVKGGRYVDLSEHPGHNGKYDASQSLFEQDNPLKFIAKLIDIVAGKPIESTVKLVTGSEELAARSVRFRPTMYKDAMHGAYMKQLEAYEAAIAAGKTGAELPKLPKYYRGRSLGNEVVSVTFDFFSASVGDAMGRDMAGWIDPNTKQEWRREDGSIDVPAAARTLINSGWRYLSYNGGEDWAVALPYVYFMKGQRSAINKMSHGWENDFDRGLHGASFKTIPHHDRMGHVEPGKKAYSIVGNYNFEGALDFQNRFTVYNMGTLAYREAYDYANRKLHGKHAVLYGSPDTDTSKQSVGTKAGNIVKWMARSVVKGFIYMTPAVPFFWITRVPQTNYRGLFINPKTGEMLSYAQPNKGPQGHTHYKALFANDLSRGPENPITGLNRDTPVYWAKYDPDPSKHFKKQFAFDEGRYLPGMTHSPVAHEHPFDAFRSRNLGMAHEALGAVGNANYKLARVADGAIGKAGRTLAQYPAADRAARTVFSLRPFGQEGWSRFTHSFVNASMSYTPYVYAKAELANMWDDGKMDMATERMIDGASHLNWGEFKAGAGEVWRSILKKPLLEDDREAEAQRRILMDTSPPIHVNPDEEHEQIKRQRVRSNWRERVVQAHPDDRPEVGKNEPKSHTEREEMRKALEEMHPPTNSIN